MPHLRIRGMKKIEIVKISTELLDELVRVIGVSRDLFTIEYIDSTYISDGQENNNPNPFVEVLWFSKEDKMDEVAAIITTFIKPFDYDDVAVYFVDLKPEHYFKNGKHF